MTKAIKHVEAQALVTKTLDLVHSDKSGKMSTPSGKNLYFIVLIDDHTRVVKTYLMERKSQALKMFQNFIMEVANPEGLKVKTLRTDNGDEYMSHEFKKFCLVNGIQREITTRYSPEHNENAGGNGSSNA